MMKYRYKIKPCAQRKIKAFYFNVAKNIDTPTPRI